MGAAGVSPGRGAPEVCAARPHCLCGVVSWSGGRRPKQPTRTGRKAVFSAARRWETLEEHEGVSSQGRASVSPPGEGTLHSHHLPG